MTTEIETYRTLLRYKYEDLDRTLDGLPDEALLWRPFDAEPLARPRQLAGRDRRARRFVHGLPAGARRLGVATP